VRWGRFSLMPLCYVHWRSLEIFTPVLIALEIIGNLRRKKVGSFLKVAPFGFRNRGQDWLISSIHIHQKNFLFEHQCSSQSCCNLMSLLSHVVKLLSLKFEMHLIKVFLCKGPFCNVLVTPFLLTCFRSY
jgi:hypothetical protein